MSDSGIDTLLDLNGQIVDQDNGYWIKIEAWKVSASKEIPHGIRYSLTLHDAYGKRLLGYDNAHAAKPAKKFRYAGKVFAYDHVHRHMADKGQPYLFKDAYQLISDFFADVDAVLREVNK